MGKEIFHSQAKGSYQENDDDYALVTEEDGSKYVEHEWSHVDVRKTGNIDKGTKRYSVEEFLASDVSAAIKGKLKALL